MLPKRQTCRFPISPGSCGVPGIPTTPCVSGGVGRSTCGVNVPTSGSVRHQGPIGRSMRDGGLSKARHEALAGRHRHTGIHETNRQPYLMIYYSVQQICVIVILNTSWDSWHVFF